MTANDLIYMVCNHGEMPTFLEATIIDHSKIIVVEVAESTWWANDGNFKWAYSDRIVITHPSNLRKGYLSHPDFFLTYVQLSEISIGIQQSILENLRRYKHKWQNS
jgi:hypothetical protein